MLSLFPQILFLAPFSALLIRISLALLLAYTSWKHVGVDEWILRVFGIIEIAVAVALFVGSWTQAAGLVAAVIVLIWLFIPGFRRVARTSVLLALVLSLSLVVTGPGAFAFDLPL